MTEATKKQQILGQAFALSLPRMLDLLSFRIGYYDRSVDPARPEYNQHVIFAFWHEYIGVVLPRWGHTPLTVLCSHHRDGEMVNQTALSLGLHIVRGSSNRGGSSAIRQLKKHAKFSSIAITPDGPRGPRREMALGPVYLASLLKIPIVPVGVGIDRPYRLDTWDRFAVPRPFSRVRMVFGPKVHIPARTGREQLEAQRLGVQTLMNDLTDEAERWAVSGKKMIGEQPFVRARRCNRKIFDGLPGNGSAIAPANAPTRASIIAPVAPVGPIVLPGTPIPIGVTTSIERAAHLGPIESVESVESGGTRDGSAPLRPYRIA